MRATRISPRQEGGAARATIRSAAELERVAAGGDEEPYSLATPALRTAAVTLPEGVSVNPSAADGPGVCTEGQIGLGTDSEPTCPNASKIGTAEIVTPLLDDPLEGSIYLATPNDNPVDRLLAVYVVVENATLLIKLAGQIEADPDTGQLVTTFEDNPQVPFSDLELSFFGGPRGAPATPQTCGTFETTAELTPWSAPDSGFPATASTSFDITPCPGRRPVRGKPRRAASTLESGLVPTSPTSP